ncbi:hypothetical protein [Sphingomicrobium nitratireducens]|uniref:hypothetical protein n=1 Tax=Sphingomicrobium nitratireducens TaxID=2964666 RepID=UPI00223EDE7B|nr:hypothetical protein [Sphingomicrobium nitratireducens]
MTRTVTALDERLAHELDHARLLLEEMGDELATDIEVVTSHGVALQTVDIVMQIVGHIANVVRAQDQVDAVENIGMHELKMKLKSVLEPVGCEKAA